MPSLLCPYRFNRLLSLSVLVCTAIFLPLSTLSQYSGQQTVERIATGFQFVEGPVWNDSLGLLFSDIWSATIFRWSPADANVTAFMKPSDSSNGLTYDKQGRLVLTQMQKRRVSRREPDGSITPLASVYGGKRFNSPNDIIVSSAGSIFFTDPDFNVPPGQARELSFKGIFRLSTGGVLQVIDSTFDKPNGICFSPDEKRLYVNESAQHKIYVWDVTNDSTFVNKRLFYTIPQSGYADGMKADSAGNVYCTGPGGVWVVSAAGSFITLINTPETPANCAWGDADRKTLYITAQKSVYRTRPGLATGVRVGVREGSDLFGWSEGYPNPFNPSCEVRYHVAEARPVRISVCDMLGREVAVLVDEQKPAGEYTTRFDADGIASGFYLCRMEAGPFVRTQRLCFLR
jgi:gluconolactonase